MKRRKIFSAFFAAVLSIGMIPLLSACGTPAASPAEDFEYEFENGEVTITGYIGTDLEIVIPDTIDKRPVTVIGKKAFMDYDMKSIVIPDGVTTIEANVFCDCYNLEEIVFPDSLYYIDSNCDLHDTAWYKNQPDGILYINNILVDYKETDENAEETEININSGTKVIADYAFNGCNAITSISMPNSIEYIGEGAFSYCINLCNIKLSNNLNSVGIEAFYNTNITEITIPKSVTEIGEKAFGYYLDSYEVTHEITQGDKVLSTYNTTEYDELKIGLTIYGKSDSAAETYANENDITFVEE